MKGEERRQETHSRCDQHFLFPPVRLLNILGTSSFMQLAFTESMFLSSQEGTF